MKFYAARYMMGTADKAYEIVLYESLKMADENPHDYYLSFSKSQWQKMGCRVPKQEETMTVEFIAKEID